MNMPDTFKNKYSNIKSTLHGFWLFYFMITLFIMGPIFGYVLSAPLYLIGIIFKPARTVADKIICGGTRALLYVQPWFLGSFELDLPKRKTSKGLLLISNHRSHLDSFILLSHVQGVRIFAKKSLFYIPVLGLMMWLTRQIPAKRGQMDSFLQAMEIVRERLRNGEIVHVFPEMTRCGEGFTGVQNFSSYPFLVAIQEKVLIVPIVFFGTDQVWPKGKNALRFRHPMRIRSLAPIDSAQFSSAGALKDEVHRLIETNFQGNLNDHSRVPVHSHLQQQSSH